MRCICPEVRCGNGTIEGTEKLRRRQRDRRRRLLGDLPDRDAATPARWSRAPCVPDCGDGHRHRQRAVRPRGQRPQHEHGLLGDRAAGTRAGPAPAPRRPSAIAAPAATAGRKGWRPATTATRCRSTAARPTARTSRRARPAPPARSKCGDGVAAAVRRATTATSSPATAARRPASRESGYTCRGRRSATASRCRSSTATSWPATPTSSPARPGQTAASIGPGRRNAGRGGQTGARAAGGGRASISSAANFAQWYRNVASVNHATPTTMTLWNNGMGAYVNRWGPNGEQWVRSPRPRTFAATAAKS